MKIFSLISGIWHRQNKLVDHNNSTKPLAEIQKNKIAELVVTCNAALAVLSSSVLTETTSGTTKLVNVLETILAAAKENSIDNIEFDWAGFVRLYVAEVSKPSADFLVKVKKIAELLEELQASSVVAVNIESRSKNK